MPAQLQTLQEFLHMPFGLKEPKIPDDWKGKARNWYLTGKIKLQQILELNGSYFYNIEVPSESNPSLHYDVVIQFIPNASYASQRPNVRSYYVKFFSNSPSFVYKYAALYYQHGMLIDALMVKLGDKFMLPPEKTNPSMELGYDKSIYLACEFMVMNNFFVGFKDVFNFKRTKDVGKFLDGVLEFDTMMSRIDIENFKKSTEKQIEKDKKSGAIPKPSPVYRPKETRNGSPGVITPKAKVTAKKAIDPMRPLKKLAAKKGKLHPKASTRSTRRGPK